MTSVFSMKDVAYSLIKVPSSAICNMCHLTYSKKWCSSTCFFCITFLPTRDSRYSILKDIEWYFIKSGEDDRSVFYNQYIDYLNMWCTRFCISYKKEELSLELELRNAST
jgi:hypothetical protein